MVQKKINEKYNCYSPIYINLYYSVRCFKCNNCKKFLKQLDKEIKSVIDIPDWEPHQKEFADNVEQIC